LVLNLPAQGEPAVGDADATHGPGDVDRHATLRELRTVPRSVTVPARSETGAIAEVADRDDLHVVTSVITAWLWRATRICQAFSAVAGSARAEEAGKGR
jgi:hypothetical protein